MVLMLDGLGTRYHMLPSVVLDVATTFDLYIMEKALTYHNNRTNPDAVKSVKGPSEAEMFAMIDAVNKRKG